MKILIYGLLTFMLISPAYANEPPLPPIELHIGIDAEDFAKGLTAVAAAGSHTYDYSTLKWQASIAGAFILDTSFDAVSFGLAKRFDTIDVLWSTSFTRFDDNDLITLSASFQF